jgi:hypothetical protein
MWTVRRLLNNPISSHSVSVVPISRRTHNNLPPEVAASWPKYSVALGMEAQDLESVWVYW